MFPLHAVTGCEGVAFPCCKPHAADFHSVRGIPWYARLLQGHLPTTLIKCDDCFSLVLCGVATRYFCRSVQHTSNAQNIIPPLQVLGLHQGADSEAVQRQYNKLKREKRGDEQAISKIENAHSSLMMRNLTARMQAGPRSFIGA